MLDQKLIRENPTSVQENLSLRGKVYNISHIHQLTLKKKKVDIEISSLQSESKKLSKSIGQVIGKSQNKLSYQDIGFKIGPLINSSGRMAKANDVTVTAGTQLKYKVEFANQAVGSKETRVTGISLQY